MARAKSNKSTAWSTFCEVRGNGFEDKIQNWQQLWKDLEESGLHYDLAEPIAQSAGSQYQALVFSLYAYVPAARPFVLDMAAALGAGSNLVEGILDVVREPHPFQDQFMEQMDELFEWAMSRGARFPRLPGETKTSDASMEWTYEKACLHLGGREQFIRRGSMHDLCVTGRYLLTDFGCAQMSQSFTRETPYRQREQLMYDWLKKTFGLELAFSKAFGDASHVNNLEWAVYSHQDLADVFCGGDLLKLLRVHQVTVSEVMRNASKIAMRMVLQDPNYKTLLAGAERTLIAHWRKAGEIDEIQWLQLVETSDSKKEDTLARHLGL